MPISGEGQSNWFHKDYQYLKIQPEGMKNLRKNYSQVWQDIFALVVNDAKVDGTFIEVGGAQPFVGNNTWLLEEGYNWKGLSIELDHDLAAQWEGVRPNTKMFEADAMRFNYVKAVDDLGLPRKMDYLSFDLEPPHNTLEALRNFPFDQLKFNCITYEHDAYRQWGEVYGHRKIFKVYGYDLVGTDIKNGPCTMEEWYIHKSVSQTLRDRLRSSGCQAWELLLDL
tara:strand:- start:1051 stop:1725 length:675 start_codon:yes stop_codon:yes gene_type:complete